MNILGANLDAFALLSGPLPHLVPASFPLSPDRTIVSGSDGGTVRLWDLEGNERSRGMKALSIRWRSAQMARQLSVAVLTARFGYGGMALK